MSGKKSRTKGLSFERWAANSLAPVFPKAKRHLEMQKEEAMGFDLDNTGPYKIQCKAYKKYAPLSKIEEVQRQPGDIPVLLTKGDRKKPIVAMYFDDWLDLLIQLEAKK